MKSLEFNFENSGVSDVKLKSFEKKLDNKLKVLKKATSKNYDEHETSINLPFDNKILKESKETYLKVKTAKTIIVIGIGGSNLGTKAVFESIKGSYNNQLNAKKIYFADTVDSNSISDIEKLMLREIKEKRKVVLNVISKSGTTTETIANFEYLLDSFKKVEKNYKNYIVVTSSTNSKLWNFGKESGFHLLEHQDVGGRFSVLSNVGIFPLTFMDIDCKELHKGAAEMREICLQKNIKKNFAMRSASSVFFHKTKGRNIFDLFIFSSRLESLGKWYRQLLGESIGKSSPKDKRKIHFGITPNVSIGSTDLHSMGQLYLGGAKDKFHCFVRVENSQNVKLGNDKEFEELVPHLQKKKFDNLMDIILKGTQGAFKKRKVPFYEVKFDKINEFNIGAFLQFKMMEVMFLGDLFGVNEFDQPNVEDYKVITRKLLQEK